jgi:tripartite-type tricarboxylate transporter receptor subunit TctC
MTHVPYRGGTQPLVDLLSGRIDLMVDSVTVTGAGIRAGTVRALGVTSPQPWPLLEGAPPVAATLPGFEVLSWVGLAAPAQTPPAIVERLNAELRRALGTPELRDRLATLGAIASPNSPQEMRAMVTGQVAQWRGVVESAGIERQ